MTEADAPAPELAPDEPPLEQLAQQQAGKPVAFVRVWETLIVTDRGLRFHLVGVGADGSLWERFSGLDPEPWHEIERPVR